MKRVGLLILLAALSAPAWSAGLKTLVRTQIPEDATTLGEAVNYYLEPTGYRLATSAPAPEEAERLLSQRVLNRGGRGVMRAEEAILKLFEVEVALIVDRDAKLVSVGYLK